MHVRAFLLPLLLCLPLALAACGPKEIGTDIPRADLSVPAGPDPAESMRYPLFGFTQGTSAAERLTYNINRTEVMTRFQDRVHATIVQGQGGVHPESPRYRETPAMASPFRQ